MFWYGHNAGGWGYACMGVGMALVAVLLIVGVVALITLIAAGDRQNRPSAPATLTAEQLLAQRFAGGDINHTEYTDRLATLRDHTRT